MRRRWLNFTILQTMLNTAEAYSYTKEFLLEFQVKFSELIKYIFQCGKMQFNAPKIQNKKASIVKALGQLKQTCKL